MMVAWTQFIAAKNWRAKRYSCTYRLLSLALSIKQIKFLMPDSQKYSQDKDSQKSNLLRVFDVCSEILITNPRLRDRKSCYRFCFANNCKWHDGLMVDIFVFPHESRWVYPLKQMTFEGFLFFLFRTTGGSS